MTELMEKAMVALHQLPKEDQEIMAQWILEELESEALWKQAFSQSLPQLEALARKALEDHQAGRTRPFNPDELE